MVMTMAVVMAMVVVVAMIVVMVCLGTHVDRHSMDWHTVGQILVAAAAPGPN
jgi:hypothetical protein